MFDDILAAVRNHCAVVATKDIGAPYTQIVLGEYHYVARVQRDILRTLTGLHGALGFQLLGKEGNRKQFVCARHAQVDLEKAISSNPYMYELLRRRLNATSIFAAFHAHDVVAKPIEDQQLRIVAGRIDRRYFQIFTEIHGTANPREAQELRRTVWLALLKHVVLGARSDSMVQNLYLLQKKYEAPLAVLVCGLAHTPICPEYEPFSVMRRLETLPINAIVAVPTATWESWNTNERSRDPFDFYSSTDELETSPYK